MPSSAPDEIALAVSVLVLVATPSHILRPVDSSRSSFIPRTIRGSCINFSLLFHRESLIYIRSATQLFLYDKCKLIICIKKDREILLVFDDFFLDLWILANVLFRCEIKNKFFPHLIIINASCNNS